jgi:predicted AAA+ superfamily ATPase
LRNGNYFAIFAANKSKKMNGYKSRIADKMLVRKLAGKGAVLIEGPKWCGKTTTAEQVAVSKLYMSDMDAFDQNIEMARINPGKLLSGAKPRLIDEWQVAPKLWDAVRFSVDHENGYGLYILTGSAVPPPVSQIIHSGTGRFARLMMRPMSLYESGESTGSVSLSSLFDAPNEIDGMCELALDDIAFLVCRGGWPNSSFMNGDIALDQANEYYDAVVHTDISRVDGVKRDIGRVRQLMKSYARYQGCPAPLSSLRKDMLLNDVDALSIDTVSSYVQALKQIFVVEDMPAWNPNLRSRTAIRTTDNRYFIDSSIATAALGASPSDLMNDLKLFGLLFETMCMRDLRVYADALQGEVYHYRDSNGLECDAVVHLRNGSYGLIEIKLGGADNIEAAAKTLHKLGEIIDTARMKAPAFKMVLTAVGRYAYRREDGVYVVPIACLKD